MLSANQIANFQDEVSDSWLVGGGGEAKDTLLNFYFTPHLIKLFKLNIFFKRYHIQGSSTQERGFANG